MCLATSEHQQAKLKWFRVQVQFRKACIFQVFMWIGQNSWVCRTELENLQEETLSSNLLLLLWSLLLAGCAVGEVEGWFGEGGRNNLFFMAFWPMNCLFWITSPTTWMTAFGGFSNMGMSWMGIIQLATEFILNSITQRHCSVTESYSLENTIYKRRQNWW